MNKAIFWDLLGTLGGDSRTLISEGFDFFDETVPALKTAQANSYLNLIITNQSHIAHNRILPEEYEQALENLLSELEDKGVHIKEVYTCPHQRKDKCNCKKPKTLLAEKAIKKYKISPSKSYVIGDSGKNDMMLANNLGINSVLLLTGGGIKSLTTERNLWSETKPTFIAEDALDAVNKIVKFGK